jgi:hypothetical protein
MGLFVEESCAQVFPCFSVLPFNSRIALVRPIYPAPCAQEKKTKSTGARTHKLHQTLGHKEAQGGTCHFRTAIVEKRSIMRLLSLGKTQ